MAQPRRWDQGPISPAAAIDYRTFCVNPRCFGLLDSFPFWFNIVTP